MTIKQIFVNPMDARLRAGWRMCIFFGAFSFVVFPVIKAVGYLFSTTGLIHSQVAMLGLTYAVLFGVTWAVCAFLEKRPLRSVGFGLHERTLIELGQGIGLGTIMMAAIFGVNIAFGFASFSLKTLTFNEVAAMTSYSVAEFTIVAIGEELLFRGYLFQTLVEGTSKLIAVLLFAVFFAFVHIGNPNSTVFSFINIAIAGVWLSAAYFKTRGLWLPIGLHFSWNFFQNHVFSFPVSGLNMSDKTLGVLYDNGPAWLTGGKFGPEGGALATVALILGTLLIWYAPQVKASASAWVYEPVTAEEAVPVASASPYSDATEA